MRVLIAHDDSVVLSAIGEVLRASGHQTHEARSIPDVLAMAHEHRPGLVLLFASHGGLNALEAAEALHGLPANICWMLIALDRDASGAPEPLAMVHRAADVAAMAVRSLMPANRRGGWPRPPLRPRLGKPGTTAGHAARWILLACDAEEDVATLDAWRRLVGASYTRLRDVFVALDILPSDARDFMRVLRALVRCAGNLHGVRAELAFGDPRTTKALLERAGLLELPPTETIAFDDFLMRQTFVDSNSQLLPALRSLIAALHDRDSSPDDRKQGGGGTESSGIIADESSG